MAAIQVSPLVRVERGDLKPKVLALYDDLFKGSLSKSDGYWTEFFMLRCKKAALASTFDALSPEKLLASREVTQQLFVHATEHLESSHDSTIENTLHILSVFFPSIFHKKFVSYSSDVITVITGLESVDKVFFRFLDAMNKILSDSSYKVNIRVSAIRTTTIIASGAYPTSLVSCFLYRDIFGAIMDFINSPDCKLFIGDAMSLIGLLASYDKLEGNNPYQVRLTDFVDDSSMQVIARASGHAWEICLSQYQSLPETNTTMSGLESITYWLTGGGITPHHDKDKIRPDAPDSLASVPHPAVSLLLATYEFVNANKVFARKFLESKGEIPATKGKTSNEKSINLKSLAPPSVVFISLCSYLLQDQVKDTRAAFYSRLAMIIIRTWLEEPSGSVSKLLLTIKTNQFSLANYRTPALTTVHTSRVLIEGVLDSLQGCLRFNMKRLMDYHMYSFCLQTLFQALFLLKKAKARISYIWKDLWRTLLSLVRFMNSHPPTPTADSKDSTSNETKHLPASASKCAELVTLVIACCLIHGDTFLQSDDEYDDLFYKVVESSDDLTKFIENYSLQGSTSASAIETVCKYFRKLMQDQQISNAAASSGLRKLVSFAKGPSGVDSLTTNDVIQIIRGGLEGLSLYQFVKPYEPLSEGLPPFKEADERNFVKKITRVVIQDVSTLYG